MRCGQLLKVCVVFIDMGHILTSRKPKAISLSGPAFIANGKEAELLYIIEWAVYNSPFP
jgi:hypothetical protein